MLLVATRVVHDGQNDVNGISFRLLFSVVFYCFLVCFPFQETFFLSKENQHVPISKMLLPTWDYSDFEKKKKNKK